MIGTSPCVLGEVQIVLLAAGHRPESADCRVAEEIRGIPPLVRFATLADRRHVLTQDSGGMVALWDIACGAIVEQYGKVPVNLLPFLDAGAKS